MLLNFALIVLTSITVIASIMYVTHSKKQKQQKLAYYHGIDWLSTIKTLLTAIQQHRGLVMGYLNGDKSLLARITPLQKEINQQITAIYLKGGWIKNNQIWLGIVDHWQRLAINYPQHDSKYCFNQHCNLITNMLYLIEDCAENHHLQELLCENDQYAEFLWTQLLLTVEYIGQVRAIGTSIAAAKGSTSVDRIKLNYLQSCLNDFVLNDTIDIDPEPIQGLLNALTNNILIDKPNLSAQEFFNLATEVSALILKTFDLYLNGLKKHYKPVNK